MGHQAATHPVRKGTRNTAGAPPAGGAGPPAGAAARLFATPRPEVDLICRVALARHLSLRHPAIRHLIDAGPLTPGTRGSAGDRRVSSGTESGKPGPRAHLLAVKEELEGLTIVDPACGQGEFLLGMLDLLEQTHRGIARHLGLPVDGGALRRSIVERNLYGVEIQRPALALAAGRLQDAAGAHLAPAECNLVCGDSLVERVGFSWVTRFADVMAQGGFDLVIGNPPFMRHELIDDPLGMLSKAEYRRLAHDTVHRRLPEFFGWDPNSGRAGRPLDGRTDLSVLFTFLGFSLLRPAGTLAFVLPSAALQAGYGKCLHQLLARQAQNSLILENSRQRTFPAGVNTVALLASRPSGAADDVGDVRRVWMHPHPPAPETRPQRDRATGRSRRGGVPSLTSPKRGRGVGGEGGSGVRGVMQRLEGRMTTVGTLGKLRYPVKTGINRFFYPSQDTIERFGIEPEFCRPIVRSPRAVDKIALTPEDVACVLFTCHDSLSLLQVSGKWGALAYIRWGAEQVTPAGVPWPLVPSIRSRRPWYAASLPPTADVLCPRFFDRRYFFVVPTVPLLEDQTFYGLKLDDRRASWLDVVAAVMNCSLTYLFVETFGRTGLGEGVRQYALSDMAALPVIDPEWLEAVSLKDVLGAYRTLSARPILPVDEEVHQPDRLELDAAIAASVGIPELEMHSARQALVDLAGRRRERARSLIG